jgi:hypothetical protein
MSEWTRDLEEYVYNNLCADEQIEFEEGDEFYMETFGNEDENDFIYRITYTLEDDPWTDYPFFQHLKSLGLDESYDDKKDSALMWAFSCLHELGHIATLQHFTPEERRESFTLVQIVNIAYTEQVHSQDFKDFDSDIYNRSAFAYWNTPTEKIAQEYVVKIANSRPDIVDGLMNIYEDLCLN